MKKISHFILGFVLGALVFGSITIAAVGIIATPSEAKVYVNGWEKQVDAYLIEGRNYFALRDMAEAVGFEVSWDGERGIVSILTGRYGYTESEPMPSGNTSVTSEQTQVGFSKPDYMPTAGTAATDPGISNAASLTLAGGYDTRYNPLPAGTIVRTEPVATSIGSIAGEYEILHGMEERPWLTTEGITWPNVPLPEWQAEWDSYPRVEMPDQPPVRFKGERMGFPYDTLKVYNYYETERMIRTIYKYAKNNPSLWQGNDPASNIPNFTISIEFADDMAYNVFYPFRDWEVQKLVESTGPEKVFRVFVIDTYNNGRFLDTEYFFK